MKLKGNYVFMFAIQFLAGVVTYFACIKFGMVGIVIGFIPFLVGMTAVQKNYTPDEREMALLQKSNSYESMLVAVIMAIVYMFFPQINWFFIFVSSISIVRGIIGIVLFTVF